MLTNHFSIVLISFCKTGTFQIVLKKVSLKEIFMLFCCRQSSVRCPILLYHREQQNEQNQKLTFFFFRWFSLSSQRNMENAFLVYVSVKLSFMVFQMVQVSFPCVRDGSRPLLLFLSKPDFPGPKRRHGALMWFQSWFSIVTLQHQLEQDHHKDLKSRTMFKGNQTVSAI